MADIMMVVVSYNSPEKTWETIRALKSQSVEVDIVVWDNASTDNTRNVIMSIPGISVELSKQNLLWSPAINRAIRTYYNGQEFIGFMNNDIVLQPDCLEKLMQGASRDYCGIIAPTGAGLGGQQDHVIHVKGAENVEPMKEVSFVVGACCVLRYDVWKQVGELDERMPLGADDHDYCIRIKHEGYGIYVRQDTFADHSSHSSSKTVEGKQNWDDWGGKSWDAFNVKWDGYYTNEEQAVKSHWNGAKHHGFNIGTGWSDEKYNERVKLGNY